MSERTAAELRTIAGKTGRVNAAERLELADRIDLLENQIAALEKANGPLERAQAFLADPEIMRRCGVVLFSLDDWLEPSDVVVMVLQSGLVRSLDVNFVAGFEIEIAMVHPLFTALDPGASARTYKPQWASTDGVSRLYFV